MGLRTRLGIPISLLAFAAVVGLPRVLDLEGRAAERATRAELDGLRGAVQAYCDDHDDLPRALVQLVRHPGNERWRGPYLTVGADARALQLDGWGRPYQVLAEPERLCVSSAGADGRVGSSDDLELNLEAAQVRRQVTLERLRTIHQAIVQYTRRHGIAEPLEPGWVRAHRRLVAEGLLPAGERFLLDAWGRPLVEHPRGLGPVVRVTSLHLGGAPDSND